MVQKYTDKEEQKCNRCGKKYTCQTFQCNTNSSKGQAKTLATYEDITSTEDAIFVEQQNTTLSSKIMLQILVYSASVTFMKICPYEVP